MGLQEDTIITIDPEYGECAALDDYGDKISVKVLRKGEKRAFMKFVFPQLYANGEKYPGDKAFPLSVGLGDDPTRAVAILLHWAMKLAQAKRVDIKDIYQDVRENGVPEPGESEMAGDFDDDIPF